MYVGGGKRRNTFLGSKSVARLFRRKDEIIAQQLIPAKGVRAWWIELYYGELAFRKVT